MPFSLTNAPAVFQALINEVFRDLLGKGVIAYIDDILVYSTSMEEHVRQVREVLTRLQWYHLYVKLEKCKFHRSTVAFLGYVISHQGVEMDVVKVRAITEWFCSYHGTLTLICRSWWRQTPPAVGWEQYSPNVMASLGSFNPCAFYSRKLTVAEVNYNVGNRELLAIKAALEEWRHWLEGARHPFQVLIDHCNLEYLRGAKRLNPRQARWAMFFTRFVFTVTYRPGSKNGKADALSRQFSAANESGQPDLILPATAILSILVALPGPGCGGVRLGMPHVRAGMDQSPTSGGTAGAPSGSPSPLVALVGGLFDRLT
ncbi:hypothetical protein QTP70_015680 [Hemibagrus guttatus]|uniref:ribonuclease H n=1 Tax=Hemibagrus guttatus TaxID=175788 RepID=A0AAE0USQ9_9TELE|nr:hypothetical protein QTP70_015680 [Hemibagrus guttatus]